MNKSSGVTQNSFDGLQKDSLHAKKKSGSTRDIPSDAHIDDPHGTFSKTTSHFDCSNLGLFFNARTPGSKTTTEPSTGKPSYQKKSREASSSREGAGNQRQPSSKDFSNLDELVENTTIIPSADKGNVRSKKSVDIANMPKDHSNDLSDELTSLENALFNTTKKSIEKSFSSPVKTPKEDKTDDIDTDISKIGFNMDDDQELNSFTDSKASKNSLKVLERLKSRALSNRHSSFSGNIFETPKTPDGSQSESRTNSSIFANTSVSKLAKAVSPIILQYQDKDIYNDDNNEQDNLITELFENLKKNSEEIPLDKSKEISQNDLNPRLLTEKTANKTTKQSIDFVPDTLRETRRKPNLSLISTESTIDSDNFTLPHDPQNNSFSTPFSGANGSFNASGKLDFSSPVKIDSERINSDTSDNYMKAYSMQKNLKMSNPRMSMMNSQRGSASTNLNQSCMTFCGGFVSGNNSDRSDEYLNNFNTNQGNQQNYHSQGFNMSNPNMMEQFFIAPPSLADSTLRTNTDGNFSTTPTQSPSTPGLKKKSNNSNDKNSARMRRKNQESEEGDLYEIDLDKVETCGRTTLMVRNIPNKYDLTLILQTIDKNHKGKFDFFYLPIDFSNRCNFGYAFINFSNTKNIKDFYNDFNGKKWEKFNSEKICEIKYARIQGHAALMQHFQYSRVMNQQDKKLRPYIPTNKYGLPNKQKIEELVRQQKLASVKDGKDLDSVRNYREVYHY